MIIIRKPCQRWGKRAVLRLDLKVDRVAVCLRERMFDVRLWNFPDVYHSINFKCVPVVLLEID